MRKGLFVLGAALLWCAQAFAMLPVEGVYEKVDDNGNVVARLQCWDAEGSVGREGENWGNSSGAPYICVQGFANGTEVSQTATCYIWKNDATGSGETAVVLNREACAKAEAEQPLMGERRQDVAAFSWKSEDEVYVGMQKPDHSFDKEMSGNYRRVDRARELPISMLMYAYEKNQKPEWFSAGAAKPRFVYSLLPVSGPFNLKYLKIQDDEYDWHLDVYAENDFNVIIEADRFNKQDFYFPFVHNNFVSRTENTWAYANVEGPMPEAAAMKCLRQLYLDDSYAGLRPGSNGGLRLQDFYGGEGANAVYTHTFSSVLSLVEMGYVQKGWLSLSSNGDFKVTNYTGNATVNGTEIRFRLFPSAEGRILGEMNNGETVKCLGFVDAPDRRWAHIERANGDVGFMADQYLRGVERP